MPLFPTVFHNQDCDIYMYIVSLILEQILFGQFW